MRGESWRRVIRLVVDNRLRIPIEDLSPELADKIRDAFTHLNPEHRKDPKNEPAHDRSWTLDQRWLAVPRGGTARVRDIIRKAGQELRVFDRRALGLEMKIPHLRPLWAHQERAVQAILQKQNCLMRAGTGTGKTTAALAAACRIGRWSLTIVWTKGLLKQWRERIVEECGISPQDVGIIQGPTRRLRPLTVALQQSLAANPLEDVERSMFGTVICDEVQFFAARTFFAAVDPFEAKHRIGVSADERRHDHREYLIYDLFGDVADDFSSAEAVAAGLVHDVQIAMVPTEWEPGPWYRAAMLSRNVWKIRAAQRRLQEELADSRQRAVVAADIATREAREGHSVALLADRLAHCDNLAAEVRARGFPPGMMVGGPENEREFDAAKEKIKRRELRVVVGTIKAIGTGIDVPAFDRGIVCSHVTNDQQLLNQLKGRFCRTDAGKEGARLYVLWDRALRGMKAIENVTRWHPNVVVLDQGEWVEGKEFLGAIRQGRKTGFRRKST